MVRKIWEILTTKQNVLQNDTNCLKILRQDKLQDGFWLDHFKVENSQTDFFLVHSRLELLGKG